MASTNCADCPLNSYNGEKVRAFRGRSFVGDCTYAEVSLSFLRESVFF